MPLSQDCRIPNREFRLKEVRQQQCFTGIAVSKSHLWSYCASWSPSSKWVSGMIRNWLLMASLGVLACSLDVRADEPRELTSPADLWHGYDPNELPLDAESLERWEEHGCAFEKIRFTAEEVDGGKVRVFAIAGTALTGPARPGIMHIHGGGQTASLDWVRFWTKARLCLRDLRFLRPLGTTHRGHRLGTAQTRQHGKRAGRASSNAHA